MSALSGQDRVVAENLGVAVGGAGFEPAEHLSDGRVDVDHQLVMARTRSEGPRTFERVTDHLFELTDVTEGEGTQERPERRRCHHLMGQHLGRRSRPQHVGMIDVRGTGHHGVDQGQDLAARSEPTAAGT